MPYADMLLLATGGGALFAFAEQVLLARAPASHISSGAPAERRWTHASTVVVVVCAAGFVSISLTSGGVLAAIAAALLVLAARADLHSRVVPNEIVGAGAVLALIIRVWGGLPLLQPTLAATAAASALLVMRVAGRWSKGRPGMGMGDVKLGAVLGLIVGWNALWVLYPRCGPRGPLRRGSPDLRASTPSGGPVRPFHRCWRGCRMGSPFRNRLPAVVAHGTTTALTRHSERLRLARRDEHGGALLGAIMVVILVYTLFGAVVLVGMAQSHLVARDQLQRQAAYAAEAGVYEAVAQLEENMSWRPSGSTPGLGSALVTLRVRAHGAYFRVAAEAQVGDQVQRRDALIGADPGPIGQAALVLLAGGTEVVMSGSTRITGPVWTDRGTVRFEPFEGTPFTGSVAGPVERPPAGLRLGAAVEPYDRLLTDLHAGVSERLAEGLPLHVQEGDFVLVGGDSLLSRPVAVMVHGRLNLRGPFRFAEGSTFAATDTLVVEGPVSGQDGLFVSGAAIVIGRGVTCSGQFVARESVTLLRGAGPRYPSAAYARADVAEGRWGGVDMKPGSTFDGTVLVSRVDPRTTSQRASVRLEQDVQVRGAVVSDVPVELLGHIDGSVAAPGAVLERGFTTYHNWLVDASVDLSTRPPGFVVPISALGRSSPGARLRIARWFPDSSGP